MCRLPSQRACAAVALNALTAFADGMHEEDDPVILDRATAWGRVLFSMDQDLLAEAARRQRAGIAFSGVIYAHELHVTIGMCVNDLELLCAALDPPDIENQVFRIPLR